MPTSDPFTPRGILTAEQLKAYAAGKLDPAAMHEVELHLEADPLLRDAADGFAEAGAVGGSEVMRRHRPQGSTPSWIAWSLSAIVVVTAGIAIHYATRQAPRASLPHPTATQNTSTVTAPAEATIGSEEIRAAVEIPESLHIGHAPTEMHVRAARNDAASIPRDTTSHLTIDPVAPRRSGLPGAASSASPTPQRSHRPSFQLIYLQDLKLIHPQEVYGSSPLVDGTTTGVDARFTNAAERDQAQAQERRMPYLHFMDQALEKFVHNDHKGCLEDLRIVLDRYPDDVNALFYAGLCCYNLGLNDRAERLLDRAAKHTYQVFNEEADWYHALALDRLGRKDEARSAMVRIMQAKGFYAAHAAATIARQ